MNQLNPDSKRLEITKSLKRQPEHDPKLSIMLFNWQVIETT